MLVTTIHYDKNDNTLSIGDSVLMPEPERDDAWLFGGFVATITDIFDGVLIVEDADVDFFTVEPNRVERLFNE